MPPPPPSPDAKKRRFQAILSGLNDLAKENGSMDSILDDCRRSVASSQGNSAGAHSREPSTQHPEEPASPDEPPQEVDYSAWFEPVKDPTALPLFQRASTALSTSGLAPTPTSGFTSASGKLAALEPSKAALDAAAKKMKEWEQEQESLDKADDDGIELPIGFSKASITTSVAATSGRVPLSPMPVNTFQTPIRPAQADLRGKGKGREFRSPLMNAPSPKIIYPKAGQSGNAGRSHPLAAAPITASLASSAFASPSIGRINRAAPRTSFSTPFKQGFNLGESSRAAEAAKPQAAGKPAKSTRPPVQQKKRISLQSSGLVPQRFATEELEDMGMYVCRHHPSSRIY